MSLITPECITGQTDQHIIETGPYVHVHKAVVSPWQSLVEAALKSGFELHIASGFRSFDRQASIWNNKASGITPVLDITEQVVDLDLLTQIEQIEAIMLFSALPGASRHHWGSDIDVFASNLLAENEKLTLEINTYTNNGAQAPLANWLKEYAHQFGFELPYYSYNGGVAKEPWHLSYRPVAIEFEQTINQDIVKEAVNNSNLVNKEVVLSNFDALYNRFIARSFLSRNK